LKGRHFDLLTDIYNYLQFGWCADGASNVIVSAAIAYLPVGGASQHIDSCVSCHDE